ncbi:DEAD/DEAH box helicase family protein [Streptomyces nanhaiensis]|uniref:DEAD/DEAH box helicase family protein n=1 Tax=Streptomyces nanhaiensis TaxID=679319 RepID=UPI00399CF68B
MSIYLSPDTPRWAPKTEADLRAALEQGLIGESHHLDAKEALAAGKSSNKELARDLASFAVDGGTLLIGVAEDTEHRTLTLAPQPLAGLAERVENIARTLPDPPLPVLTDPIPCESDPARGYLIVHIPPSPAAPHMVDGRYFGRGDKTKHPLADADVVRLHQRRRTAEDDALALLREEIGRDPLAGAGDQSHLFLLAQPAAGRRDMLLELTSDPNWNTRLWHFQNAATPGLETLLRDVQAAPGLTHATNGHRRARGVAKASPALGEGRTYNAPRDGHDPDVIEVQVFEDGGLRLFSSRLSDQLPSGEQILLDAAVVNLTRRLLAPGPGRGRRGRLPRQLGARGGRHPPPRPPPLPEPGHLARIEGPLRPGHLRRGHPRHLGGDHLHPRRGHRPPDRPPPALPGHPPPLHHPPPGRPADRPLTPAHPVRTTPTMDLVDLPARPERAVLRPDQIRGRDAAVRHLRRPGSRGLYVAATGTGKTLVANRIGEELGARLVLFTVPTLDLAAQTALAWRADHRREPMVIVSSMDACARPDLAAAGVGATGDAAGLAAALAAAGEGALAALTVICTYDSLPKIETAQRTRDDVPAFDLAVMDEAHRIAGRADKKWAIVNDAQRIRAERRLYMTATPASSPPPNWPSPPTPPAHAAAQPPRGGTSTRSPTPWTTNRCTAKKSSNIPSHRQRPTAGQRTTASWCPPSPTPTCAAASTSPPPALPATAAARSRTARCAPPPCTSRCCAP